MSSTQRVAIVAAIAVMSACGSDTAQAVDATAAPASIPFASRNIFTWEADGEKGIWVQAIGHKWYYAEFLAPCTGIQFREGVRFRFGPAGELDRWGAVLVPHVPECFFKSFAVSSGPLPKRAPAPPGAPQLQQSRTGGSRPTI